MDYDSALNETRTDREQSETQADFRVSFESQCVAIKNQGAHLYFIKMGGGRRPVKIGRANDPKQRLKTLQVGSPWKLKLLGVLEGCGDAEAVWHSFFRREKLMGEWFEWTKLVEETVKLAIDGGDWKTVITQRRSTPAADSGWWEDSPLYSSLPKR